MLYEWEKIQALATERQAQSQDLKDMYTTLLAVLGVIKATDSNLLVSVFDSPSELASTVKTLQVHAPYTNVIHPRIFRILHTNSKNILQSFLKICN